MKHKRKNMFTDWQSPADLEHMNPDGLTYHKPEIISTRHQRLSGFCNGGHLFRFHGFIDSQGAWRCKKCRAEKESDRKFFKLVKQYMANPTPALLKMIESYQRTP